MIKYIKNLLDFNIFRKRNYSRPSVLVKYKFNLPGITNFHLLPFKSNNKILNTFNPHWNKINPFSGNITRQMR
ncbi:MAG: hypothetical protein CVT92_10830 [Bacteroidetes bacterium HGW-Bacteroidetes-1]|nr:MAG: hypothetical protein CVT92_10830 [Bacteroidetes bacterium HGW-Bacteroidetes-1]